MRKSGMPEAPYIMTGPIFSGDLDLAVFVSPPANTNPKAAIKTFLIKDRKS